MKGQLNVFWIITMQHLDNLAAHGLTCHEPFWMPDVAHIIMMVFFCRNFVSRRYPLGRGKRIVNKPLRVWHFGSFVRFQKPRHHLATFLSSPSIYVLYMTRIWQEEILWVEEQEKFRIDHFSMQENQRLRSLLLHQSARGNAPHSCHWCVMVWSSRESHVIKNWVIIWALFWIWSGPCTLHEAWRLDGD